MKIKHSSELINFILMRITVVATTFPATISTYFKFYVLGLGDASFPYLPFMYGMSWNLKQ